MSKEKVRTGGITFTGVLTVLFIALKLTGYITWSWWWVLAPLWLPTVVILGILLLYFIVLLVLAGIVLLFERSTK